MSKITKKESMEILTAGFTDFMSGYIVNAERMAEALEKIAENTRALAMQKGWDGK